MTDSFPPVPTADLFTAADWLALLEVSLTGIHLVRPVYAPHDHRLVDFVLEYLNPAAQRMTGLPEQPGGTLLAHFPHAVATGIFQYYQRVLETGEALPYQVHYQADGLDTYFQLAAKRSGERLVVSFTDPRDQERILVEQALRQTQTAAQTAQAEAERQRSELERVFEQAPVAIAVYRGANYTIELANPTVARLWGRTREQLLGKGLFEALPEVAGLGYEQLLDEVMATGTPHVAHAMEAQHDRNGQRETVYWDFVYVPVHDADGQINGAMVVATEVTAQVRARRQMEQLNQELETRVQARTQELAEQQRLLSQILAQVPAAITTLYGPEHRYTFANDRYQRLVEGRVQVGQTVAETLPEIAEQGFIELLDNVYHREEAFEGKEIAVLLAQEGVPVPHYMDFTYQPLPDEHGQTQGILVFAVDVTEQVRTRRQADTMQAALLGVAQRRAQERQDLLALFEQAPVAVALLRAPDHQLDYHNSLFEQLFPSAHAQGRPVAEAYSTLATAALLAQLDHVYQTGETYQGTDVALPTPLPGPVRYLTFTCQAYREHGQIAGVAVFIHEVTEQVQARQAVEATAHQLRLITDALPVLIGYLDRNHIYRFANRAYQAWFGQEPAALLGRPVRAVVGEAAYQAALPRMAQALAGERVDFDARMPYREDFIKHIHTSYIPDVQAGEVVGFYTLVLDVTEQVQAREQVQQINQELAALNQDLHASNAQLTRTNADLDTFVYAASHDLKAPITNIEGLLDVLREYLPAGDEQPMVARVVAMMQAAISRFQQTVGHLTEVARLQYSTEGAADHVDVAHVLEDVRLDLLPLLESSQAQLQLEFSPCPGIQVAPKSMRSILFNLLSNALKYRAPNRPPVVQVRTQCTGPDFVLEIEDNGLGLSEEQQGKLFTMFRRLHTHVEGSGVGLYLIKRMVELAGGRIAVHSQLGVGSTFTVTLPRTPHE